MNVPAVNFAASIIREVQLTVNSVVRTIRRYAKAFWHDHIVAMVEVDGVVQLCTFDSIGISRSSGLKPAARCYSETFPTSNIPNIVEGHPDTTTIWLMDRGNKIISWWDFAPAMTMEKLILNDTNMDMTNLGEQLPVDFLGVWAKAMPGSKGMFYYGHKHWIHFGRQFNKKSRFWLRPGEFGATREIFGLLATEDGKFLLGVQHSKNTSNGYNMFLYQDDYQLAGNLEFLNCKFYSENADGSLSCMYCYSGFKVSADGTSCIAECSGGTKTYDVEACFDCP